MNVLESEWLRDRLAEIPDDALFPVLNIGSSTLEFRSCVQAHIESNVFAPLRSRGGRVVHLDLKPDEGVDIVGDIADGHVQSAIAAVGVQSVMLSNLLEHVIDRGRVCDTARRLLPIGGHLIISGPRDYPYHADPIDTMFRPTIDEMHSYFPGTSIVASAVIDSGNWRQWNAAERGRSLSRTLVRLLFPLYRPSKWWEVARQAPYFLRHLTAFGLILRKERA